MNIDIKNYFFEEEIKNIIEDEIRRYIKRFLETNRGLIEIKVIEAVENLDVDDLMYEVNEIIYEIIENRLVKGK